MHNIPGTKYLRWLLLILFAEYLCFIFSGVSFSYLHGNVFFSLGADPLSWLFYAIKLPQFILHHQWAGVLSDGLILFFFICLVYNPFQNKVAVGLLLLLLLFYITLTGYHTHRNFQTGFFLVLFPFIFSSAKNKVMAFQACRYFLLFFYFSSAIFKLLNPSFFQTGHSTQVFVNQFVPYFLEGNTGVRTDVNLFLIQHPVHAQWLLMGAFIAEFVTVAGFFTKRFDNYLGICLLLFHFVNWFIMDIAPIGQVTFISLLFISRHIKENINCQSRS